MALMFYPHTEDVQRGTLEERIAVLMEAAERYKVLILGAEEKKYTTPREQAAAYNWEEMARVLREIREIAEINKSDKARKSHLLAKLAEVYEVLRTAKMSKLEAVRLALVSESNQLKAGV